MRQTGDWTKPDSLTEGGVRALLDEAIDMLDVDQARSEVIPFLRHPEATEVWSHGFFHDVAGRIRFV